MRRRSREVPEVGQLDPRNRREPSPRPGSVGPYLRIVDAKSTSGCDGAEEIAGKLRCYSFNVELYDPVKVSAGVEDLVPTGQFEKVFNKMPDPMEPGEWLTLGQRLDLRWTILVWPCLE